MNENYERISYLDYGKGIAIISVVMSHLMYQDDMKIFFNILYSFHIPFFFFLAGIVLSLTKSIYIKKLIQR